MWNLVKNWTYGLIVKSQMLFRFLWLAGPLQFMYAITFHNGDTLTDDAGCTINVTKWNGRAMAAFGPRMYSKIKNLSIRKDDVIICGYPKTGCHWMHEILHMLVHEKAEVSKYGKILEGMIEALPEILLDSLPSPRVLNTHVYYEELPELSRKYNNKIILTIRCPKDVVVSFYNHCKSKVLGDFYKYDGTFDSYFNMFINGGVDYGCFFEFYRSWEKAMDSDIRNQIYFLSFEDLKENPVQKIKDIAEFLERPVSQEFAEEVARVSSFSKLKEKRGGNELFRKGVVGDWRNWLKEDQANQVDETWRQKMSGFKMPVSSTKTYCT